MQNFEKQAEVALAFYLRRGQKALALLENDQFSQAENTLRLRKAAFHNFRAADALSATSHSTGEQLEENWLKLWQEIKEIDEKLIKIVKMKKTETETQVNRLRRQKERITKFRSAHSYGATFEKTV